MSLYNFSGDSSSPDFAIELVSKKIKGYDTFGAVGVTANVDTATSFPVDLIETGGTPAVYAGQPANFTPETVDLVSSDAADTFGSGTGAWIVRIYGLKTSTSILEESEDVNLNGTNTVTTTNTWWRIYRAVVTVAGSGQATAGNITINSTTTTANVFGVIYAGKSFLRNAVFTSPAATDQATSGSGMTMIDHIFMNVTTATGTDTMVEAELVARTQSGADVAFVPIVAHTKAPFDLTFKRGFTFPAGADIRIRINNVTANDTIIVGGFEQVSNPDMSPFV